MSESRDKFKAWLTSGLDKDGLMAFMLTMERSNGKFDNHHVEDKWQAWQASREAIEVDLHFCHPLNFDHPKVVEQLTSLGIKVKP